MELLKRMVKVITCLDYVSGTATREGAIIDMAGMEGIVVLVKHATIASSAVGDVHWEQGAASNLSDAADLEGTAIAVAADDDDQLFASELISPRKRYVRAVVTKNAANAQAESAIYLVYGPRKGPVTTGADEQEIHHSPAEGTK
jgi:hypothetical protein